MDKIIKSSAARDIYASFVVYHGTLIMGMDNTFSAYLTGGQDHNITIIQESLIGALGLYLRPGGSLLAMILTDRVGRKSILQLSLILYMISWSMIACSTSNGILIAGRALSGLASGTQKSSLLYVSEICDKKRRGRLVALRSVFNTFGASVPLIVLYYWHWRTVAFLSVIISAVGLLQICFIPETKYWYIFRRQRNNAERSLRWFSRTVTAEQVDQELRNIQLSFLSRQPSSGSIFKVLRNSENFNAFIITCIIVILQRGCGRLAITTHMEHFFAAFRTPYDSKKLVVVLGIIDFFACSMYAIAADKFRRKTMLQNTIVSLILILLSVIGYDLVLQKFDIPLPLLPVVLLYAYLIICFTVLATGISLLNTELVCHENRGTVLGLVFAIASMAGATYSFILPYALEYTNTDIVLTYFLVNLVLILTVVKNFVPETYGKELHECNKNFKSSRGGVESILGNK